MKRLSLSWLVAALLFAWASPALAQVQISIADWNIVAKTQDRLDGNHGLLLGSVELTHSDGTQFYADEVEVFENEDRIIARGNVVLVQGNNRISGDHAEFNTKTRLGTFYRATGMATVEPPRQRPQAGGIAVPQVSGQPTDIVFFGEVVEKIGNKKYKLTNGGFSACEQPTPRWNFNAGTIVLNVDHYTLLRNAIFNVKNVPLLYVPVLYFPTKEDGRATGLLIPTYGYTSLRGQAIHNAFFWAMSRWQDATFLYDWFSKTGSGTGAEYRINRGAGSDGQLNVYRLDERTVQYTTPDGGTATRDGLQSFTVTGYANHVFPFHLRSRAYANYFSSLVVNQTFSTNLSTTTNNNRRYGGNIIGFWDAYSFNGTFDRSEYFQSETVSNLIGSSPKLALTRSERPLFSKTSPLFLMASGEVAHLDRVSKNELTSDNRSLGRNDFFTQLRYPFTRWQWFTVNSGVSWRDTYYTRSLDPVTKTPVPVNLNRQFATLSAQATGPTLTRVWSTPDNGYAERFKHTIEPLFRIDRTTAIDQQPQIIVIDGLDQIFGNTTSIQYGVNNRLYAKRRIGSTSQALQIVSAELYQKYYSNKQASIVDPNFSTNNIIGLSTTPPSNFSPVYLNVRVSPSTSSDTNLHLEYDGRYKQVRMISANTGYNWTNRLQTSASWSKKFFIEELGGFNKKSQLDHSLNLSTNAHTLNNKYGGIYSLNIDILRSELVQQRITGFYNAQCCGLAFEYQKYNLPIGGIGVLPSDHRFFLSFTLAGLGNFSPFSGGLNGLPR